MREDKPSISAQYTAAARAHLTSMGVLDDELAEAMLRPRWALYVRALRRPPLARMTHNPTFSYLAARTRFHEDAVTHGLDAGIRQVVIVGAGYDSRAWRLARPDVRFFEVDHPATQADKRKRAPSGGPSYVTADLGETSLMSALPEAGFEVDAPAVFSLEGLTMYLTETQAAELLSTLGKLGGPGSRLAADFTVNGGGSMKPVSRVIARAVRAGWRAGGETTIRWVADADLPSLFAAAGWTIDETVQASDLAARYLAGAVLPTTGLNPQAFVVTAVR
jgi:methyltransferase (TIGR00027 family)